MGEEAPPEEDLAAEGVPGDARRRLANPVKSLDDFEEDIAAENRARQEKFNNSVSI